MSEELATAGPTDTVEFSNVTVVRDVEGNLTIWCGDEKLLGVVSVQIGQNVLGLALNMSRVRLAENVPATPVVQTKNVVEFTKFRAAQASLVVDNTTPNETRANNGLLPIPPSTDLDSNDPVPA